MKIAIDARTYHWTGIGSYTRNLIRHLVQVEADDEFVILVNSTQLADLQQELSAVSTKITLYPVDGSYYSWREQVLLWRQLQRVPADLFHFTHFNIPLLFNRPYVVTVHDITRFIFLGQRRQGWLSQVAYETVFARSVGHAAAVICVSETTKRDLATLPVAPLSPPTVIYQGVDPRYGQQISIADRTQVRQLLGSDHPYFLFVGVWMEHKNLRRMLRAFASLSPRYPDIRFVITGTARGGDVDLPRLAGQLGVADKVIFPGFVPAALLPALYQEALACVMCSLYEGFGLPPLEAAAGGVLVIASNVGSLPEVMQDAALYVNPEDEAGITEALEMIVNSPAGRQRLAALGKIRAKAFSWPRAAQEHWELYHDVSLKIKNKNSK